VDAAGTGTLDGTLADETSAPFSADASLKYTMGSTSANDFFLQDADIAVDLKQAGNDTGVSFYYTYNGDDDDIRFFALDQDDTELTSSIEYLKAASNATRFTTSFFIPAGTTGIRYGFQVVTGNSAKVLIVDDIELSLDPFVYKNFARENVFSARIANNGTASIVSQGGEDDHGNNAISSVSRISAGRVKLTFNSGVFTDTLFPAIQITCENTLNDEGVDDTTIINSGGYVLSVEVTTGETGVAASDKDFSVYMMRQGSDYGQTTEHVVTPAAATTEVAYYDGFTSFNGSSFILLPNELVNESGSLISVTSTDHIRFTALKRTIIRATANQIRTAGGHSVEPRVYNSSDVLKARIKQRGDAANPANGTISTLLEVGDYVVMYAGGDTMTNADTTSFSIVATPVEATFLAAVPVQKVAFIKDVQTSGTQGGTFTSGSWQTRTLNTVEGDSEIVTLATNQFTLTAGKYVIEASAPAYKTNHHTAKLYNITDSTDDIIGSTGLCGGSDTVNIPSLISGSVTLTASKTFEIQHQAQTTSATSGFGSANSFSVSQIYTQVKITKLR